MTHVAIYLMRVIGWLPLGWVRVIGTGLGRILFRVAGKRRRVVLANLGACFPELDAPAKTDLCERVIVKFAQAWMDRGWLWHRSEQIVRRRLRLTGRIEELSGTDPVVLFAPHFMGLDAALSALTLFIDRPFAGIYTRQDNQAVDRWATRGRTRFGSLQAFGRDAGIKPLLAELRSGSLIYLLPDMDFGRRNSEFVSFFGVQAATLTSLSRITKLGRAKLVPVVATMTAQGYNIEVHQAWAEYPTNDVRADTARMNLWLEARVREMTDEYYWVHRRFKTRPMGETSLY